MTTTPLPQSLQSKAARSLVHLDLLGLLIAIVLTPPAQAQINPTPIAIDVHVHTSSKQYALLDDILSSFGVTRFINLSGGQPGNGLEESLSSARGFDGRIKVCVTLPWQEIDDPQFFERQADMLRRARSLGAACLKVSKALGLYVPDPTATDGLLAIDDKRMDAIWATAGALGMPVFIHTADPKAFFEPLDEHNERLDELGLHPNWSFSNPRFPRRGTLLEARNTVIRRHQKTKFIGVHFANNPEDPAVVDAWLDEMPNLYVDIAARVPELGRHPPHAMRAFFEKHQDRILFGTDLGFSRGGIMLGSVGRERPQIIDIFHFLGQHQQWLETQATNIEHPTPIQGRWRINAIGLPPDVLKKLYQTNALKLFWQQDSHDIRDQQAVESARGMPHYFE